MESWVTLATNDDYCVGALVLAASLRRVKTTRNLAILVTKGITASLMDNLKKVFDDASRLDTHPVHQVCVPGRRHPRGRQQRRPVRPRGVLGCPGRWMAGLLQQRSLRVQAKYGNFQGNSTICL